MIFPTERSCVVLSEYKMDGGGNLPGAAPTECEPVQAESLPDTPGCNRNSERDAAELNSRLAKKNRGWPPWWHFDLLGLLTDLIPANSDGQLPEGFDADRDL